RVTKNRVNAWSSKIAVTVNNCIVPTRGENEETNIDQTPSESIDQLNIFQIKVYPNPNTGFFTIALNMSIIKQEKVKMRITNIVGQEIYTKEFFVNDDYLKENVELDGSLPTGIYTLQVMIGNKVENTTVVLSK
ncbi:MAG: T9SS type A sorting domain-containing protein, partial [Bacteroidota bacterium]|nr:T9SS type A sorting domain-containing protein [Bacteroidota bacterium]